MENYKKISLLLLLSTALQVSAFSPSNGGPSADDFDLNMPITDDNYGMTSRESTLEKEVKKQTPPAVKRPTAQPTTVQQTPKREANPFFEKQNKAKQTQETANRLAGEFIDICSEIEKRNAMLQEERDAETTYNNALKEITEKRSFGRYEKLFIGVAVVTGAAAIITDTAENAPKYAVIAIASGLGTAWSYISRRRSCQREEQELITAHETELEQAAKTTRTTVKTKEQLIQEAEATLANLKALALPHAQNAIADFEAGLNRLRA